jgi:hypothetical protein
MIARIWHGWAPQATADDYQSHYESEVSGHLRGVDGFRGARLLRQDAGDEVMFTSIAFFAVGDVRHGLVKRVAAAVGEGSIAISLVHDHLCSNGRGTDSEARHR